jgi:hypothetical protein
MPSFHKLGLRAEWYCQPYSDIKSNHKQMCNSVYLNPYNNKLKEKGKHKAKQITQ